jgi:arsenate reductase
MGLCNHRCGGANENCPAFLGKVGRRIHMGFDDPSHEVQMMFIRSEFCRVVMNKQAFSDFFTIIRNESYMNGSFL